MAPRSIIQLHLRTLLVEFPLEGRDHSRLGPEVCIRLLIEKSRWVARTKPNIEAVRAQQENMAAGAPIAIS